MKNSIIGLKALRENVQSYISRVRNGESFLVVRRSKPVFRISAPDSEEAWEEVVDFTKIRRGGIAIADLLSRL